MKNYIVLALTALCAFVLSACALAQFEASTAYIAAEVATSQILAKNPGALPTAQLLVADWTKFQGGNLTSGDEATLLQTIVASTKGKLTPGQAALLDGATQQLIANHNTAAPTPIQGAAAAIITDVMNGVARGIVVYQTPPASP